MDPSQTTLEQTAFLSTYSNTLWLGLWGAVGAVINILLYVAAGKPFNKLLALATVLSGAALAMTCAGLVGGMLGTSIMQSMGVAGCALITGMLGIKIAQKIVGLEINLPLGGGK